jgi:hypothetical protein
MFGFFALFAMVAVFFAADTSACDSLAEVILPFCFPQLNGRSKPASPMIYYEKGFFNIPDLIAPF